MQEKQNKFGNNKNIVYICTTKNGYDPIWHDESVAQQVEHNTFNVGVPGSSPGGFTRKRNREICSFFFFNELAIGGFWGENPAKFLRLRTLQRHKIGRNPMQFSLPDNSNPKRREKGVTNFSLLQKRLRILHRTLER